MTGLTYGVMAVGVILVFRSTRVINFAIGEMGGFAAALLYRLVIDWNVPFWVSFVACIAVGAIVGAALELLIVRRLFSAPRVILLVALIGAAQVLLFFQLILPDVTQRAAVPDGVLRLVGDRRRAGPGAGAHGDRRHPARSSSRSTLFMNRTKYGLAIRASAANADAARLSGINIKRMSTHRLGGLRRAGGDGRDAVRSPQPGGRVGARCRARHAAACPRGRAHRRHGIDAARARGRCRDRHRRERHHLQLQRPARAARSRAVRGRARDVAGQWPPARARRGRRRDAGRSRRGSGRFRPRCRRSGGCGRFPPFGVGFVALVALFPLVFLDLPSQREAWSRVLLYALVALSLTVLTGWAGQLSLGQFAFVGCRRHDDRRARARRRRLHPVAVPRGDASRRWSRSWSAPRRCAGRASISRSRRSRSRS